MNTESSGLTSRYAASPLVQHDRAVKTAAALIVLEVAREAINFELRLQHGFDHAQAAAVIREASAGIPRVTHVRRAPRRAR